MAPAPRIAKGTELADQLSADNVGREQRLLIAKAEGRFTRFLSWFQERVKEAPTLLVKGAITGAGALLFNYAVTHQAEIITTATSVAQTVGDWAIHLV